MVILTVKVIVTKVNNITVGILLRVAVGEAADKGPRLLTGRHASAEDGFIDLRVLTADISTVIKIIIVEDTCKCARSGTGCLHRRVAVDIIVASADGDSDDSADSRNTFDRRIVYHKVTGRSSRSLISTNDSTDAL